MSDNHDVIIKYEMVYLLIKIFVLGPLAIFLLRMEESVASSLVIILDIIAFIFIWISVENIGRLASNGGKIIEINQKEFVYYYFVTRTFMGTIGNDRYHWDEIKSIEYKRKIFSKGIEITKLNGVKGYIPVRHVEYNVEEIIEILLKYQKNVVDKNKSH